MTEIIISLLVFTGVFFMVASVIGLIRLPDVYSRMHAATKSATLGVASIMIASLLFFMVTEGTVSMKKILAIVFIFITAPVSAHMISRAAYQTGVKLWEESVQDDLSGKCPVRSPGDGDC